MQALERRSGGNSIVTAWRGTGLYPYDRDAPYWSAAIAKFGKRDDLAQSTAANGALQAPITQEVSQMARLKAVFESVNARLLLRDDGTAEEVMDGLADAEDADMEAVQERTIAAEGAEEEQEVVAGQETAAEQEVVAGQEVEAMVAATSDAVEMVEVEEATAALEEASAGQGAAAEREEVAGQEAAAGRAAGEEATAGQEVVEVQEAEVSVAVAAATVADEVEMAEGEMVMEVETTEAAETTEATAAASSLAATPGMQSNAADGQQSATATAMVPANDQQATMDRAVQSVRATAKEHNFKSLLSAMTPGECITLRARGDAGAAGVRASLIAQGETYLLIHGDPTLAHETLSIADADTRLAVRFDVPAASRAELSVPEAEAVRKREAREAAAARDAEKRAAVEAATEQWHVQQAELAGELGITFDDWQRIVALLSKPPPVRVAGKIVMNSVAIGRAVVIDAAVEAALAAPLRESVRNAAERAADQAAARKAKEPALEQQTFGESVTEMMGKLGERERTAEAAVEAKRKRDEETACARAANADAKVKEACGHLLGKAKGVAKELSIKDLLVLIKWRKGKVPQETSAGNKDEIVASWLAVAASEEELRARAGPAGAKTAQKKTAPKKTAPRSKGAKRRRKEEDSSDEDDDDDDNDDDDDDDDEKAASGGKGAAEGGEDEDDEQEEQEEEEDEGDDEDDNEDDDELDDDDEDAYEVARIHAQKNKGKARKYLVEWVGYEERTWEPAALLLNNVALEEWVEGGRATWEAAGSVVPK